jgi:hypothetical protein
MMSIPLRLAGSFGRALSSGLLWVGLSAALSSPAFAAQATAPASGSGLAVVPATASCESLARVDLADIGGAGSRVTATREQTKGGITTCTVTGVLAPAIGFQVALPTQGWTQRLMQVGCGGLCGRVSMNAGAADGCEPLADGQFVIAGTDMGHEGMDSAFGRDPQQRVDFAYRGVHLTAVAAKRLVKAFYGRKEAFAYFNGCSDGGREALMEAQRFPEDFDGIIAGAAAMNFQVQNSLYHAWQVRANTGADGKPILLAGRLALLHRAVLAQCDAADGQVDGLVSDPQACHFDPVVLQCAKAENRDDASCLSAAEVGAARRLYDGPRDPATGRRLTAGGPQPGSELAWAGVFISPSADRDPMSVMISLGVLRDLAFETAPPAGFKLADLKFDAATFDLLRPRHALYDATNPDLGAFAARGGKLIIWHGWSDPHISPLNSISYHEALRRQLGDARVAAFERLYLLPGVWHCSGGEGPSALDLLTPMMAWVEQGVAPEVVVARQPSARERRSGFGQVDGKPQGDGPPGAPPGGPGMPDGGPRGGAGGPPPGAGLAGSAPPMMHDGPPMGPMGMASAKADPRAALRPLYPYPYRAAWDGHGDAADPASYKPVLLTPPTALFDWLGADFYTPYAARRQ